MSTKVTLHDEMVAVLKHSGNPMTSSEIADQVNKRSRYLRGDNGPVPAKQIRARAHRYPKLFALDGSQISFKKRIVVKGSSEDT